MPTHGPWIIESRAQKYKSEFLELLDDRVTKPDGSHGSYATVTLKSGVAVLPIDRDNHVRLVEQFRYAVGRNSLEVPCGSIEPHEDPLDAARREVREELGIVAERWTDLGAIDLETSIVRAPVRLFVATDLHFTQPEPDGTERLRPRTVSAAAAIEMVMNGTITHAASGLLILKALAAAPRPA